MLNMEITVAKITSKTYLIISYFKAMATLIFCCCYIYDGVILSTVRGDGSILCVQVN